MSLLINGDLLKSFLVNGDIVRTMLVNGDIVYSLDDGSGGAGNGEFIKTPVLYSFAGLKPYSETKHGSKDPNDYEVTGILEMNGGGGLTLGDDGSEVF